MISSSSLGGALYQTIVPGVERLSGCEGDPAFAEEPPVVYALYPWE
jgi:hypothetical protein